MQDKFEIQITSGALKGKKITLLSNEITKSTKSRVADSFFNTIRYELRNSEFAELFGGCGLMALRAISEGAKKSYAFEKDKNSFKILELNSRILPCRDAFEAHFGDTFCLAPSVLKGANELIIYLDPPFNVRDGYDDIYEKCLALVAKISPKIAVFEHASEFSLPSKIADLSLEKSKKFGKTSLSYFIKNS